MVRTMAFVLSDLGSPWRTVIVRLEMRGAGSHGLPSREETAKRYG